MLQHNGFPPGRPARPHAVGAVSAGTGGVPGGGVQNRSFLTMGGGDADADAIDAMMFEQRQLLGKGEIRAFTQQARGGAHMRK